MRGKFNILLTGVLLGALLMILIYFAADVKRFVISWVNQDVVVLTMTVVNTCLIGYTLRLTKKDIDKNDRS